LPEPESPVMTTSWSRGISRSMFLRLCSRAPLTTIRSLAMSQTYCVSLAGRRQPARRSWARLTAGEPGWGYRDPFPPRRMRTSRRQDGAQPRRAMRTRAAWESDAAGERAREAGAGVPTGEPRGGDRRGGEATASEPGAPRVHGPEPDDGGDHHQAAPHDVGVRRPGLPRDDLPQRQRRGHEEREQG